MQKGQLDLLNINNHKNLLTIHNPTFHFNASLLRIAEKLEPIPTDLEREANYTLGRSPIYQRGNTEPNAIHTQGQLSVAC